MSRPSSHPIDHPFDFILPTVTEPSLGEPSEAPHGPLKRRASSAVDISGDNSRKRLKEDHPPDEAADAQTPALISGKQLADDLEQDLLCGCCSALLYRPVIVYPCQHYFCGR
jgi:E3 ubiquitin-protein ligase CHFR